MSFWSRNKSKKDAANTATPPTATERSASVNSSPPSAPALTNGAPSAPSPSFNTSNATYSRPATTTNSTSNGVNSPPDPDSPSAITPARSRDGGAAVSPWSMRKCRNANPFPRYSHTANVSAGKEGEIYVFGGLVKDKRRNDLYVIDSGNLHLRLKKGETN